jgi:nucleotide-binding universal stress UspA family protein
VGNKVLVPLDGSELAEAALAYAERLNKALGWTVVLLQVAQPPSAHHGHGGNPLLEGSLQELQQEEAGGPRAYEEIRRREAVAMESLAGAEDRLRAAGVVAVREVGIGNPAEVIVERAAEDDVAMIVLASHGRTGLARLFRGSVADAVVSHTARPTLVVRPFRDADQRVDLEHAEKLPQSDVDAVRRAMESPAS